MYGAAVLLRLAGVLGRRRRSGWYHCVRKSIADSVVLLVGAGKVLIAGGDHFFASGIFVKRSYHCSVSLGH